MMSWLGLYLTLCQNLGEKIISNTNHFSMSQTIYYIFILILYKFFVYINFFILDIIFNLISQLDSPLKYNNDMLTHKKKNISKLIC